MFRHSAGINSVDDAPGFTRVELQPTLNWELGSMEAEYDSPSGLYRSAWKLTDPSHVELSVTVPFGCSAALRLPCAKEETFADRSNPMFADVREGICYLEPGTYRVSYETVEPLKRIYSTDTPLRELLEKKELAEKLSQVIPLSQVPQQYRDYSIREIMERFEDRTGEVQLEELDRMLAEF